MALCLLTTFFVFQKVKEQLSEAEETSKAENVKKPTPVCDLVSNLFKGAHHHQVVLMLFLYLPVLLG